MVYNSEAWEQAEDWESDRLGWDTEEEFLRKQEAMYEADRKRRLSQMNILGVHADCVNNTNFTYNDVPWGGSAVGRNGTVCSKPTTTSTPAPTTVSQTTAAPPTNRTPDPPITASHLMLYAPTVATTIVAYEQPCGDVKMQPGES